MAEANSNDGLELSIAEYYESVGNHASAAHFRARHDEERTDGPDIEAVSGELLELVEGIKPMSDRHAHTDDCHRTNARCFVERLTIIMINYEIWE